MLIEDLVPIYSEAYHYAKRCFDHPMRVADYVSEAREKTSSYKYGIRGQCVHRGAMCADPFFEMDTNVTRGKLTDREPKRKEYYRYSFDDRGRLLLVEKYCGVDSIEVLCREGNIVYGLDFPVKALGDLHASYIRINGNVLNKGRIEVSFTTSKIEFELALKGRPSFMGDKEIIRPHFRGAVIDYQNGLPFRYFRSIRSKLCFDENETVTDQIVDHPRGQQLYLNDDGDVVRYRYINNEQSDNNVCEIRDLERPIPRKQWDNTYGLL